MSSDNAEQLANFCEALNLDTSEVQVLVDHYTSLNKDNDDALLSAKFRPSVSDFIIGNKESVSFVKSWLADWTKKPSIGLNVNGVSSRSRGRKVRLDDSDSDFLPDSDEESDDGEDNMNKALLIVGPCGCGKTSIVYTLCQEQGFKVVEINAASIRSGKVLTEQFKAATGLHRVDANSLLKESFFNSETKSINSDEKFCLEKGRVDSKKTGENHVAAVKPKSDVKTAFQRLFRGTSSKPSAMPAEIVETKNESLKSVEKPSSSKGPLDGWISRPKAKIVKDSVVPEMSQKAGTMPKSQRPDHTLSSVRSGKKRKSTKISNVIVVESDDEKDLHVDSIVIEESDNEDDFQVKKRKKKPASRKQMQAKSQLEEDSDVEVHVVRNSRLSAGLTLELKTLYLIDEADVIFADSDVGFAPALCRLIATGEKPFILTASSLDGIDRNLLTFCFLVEMSRPSEDELCKHLSAMVLSMGNCNIPVDSLKKIVDSSKCDIRMALNSLNFNCFCRDELISSPNDLPQYLPDRSFVRNLMLRSELDVLVNEVGMRWDTNGTFLKDSMAELPVSTYRNMLDLRDDLRQGAGNTLDCLLSDFRSVYGSRREEVDGEEDNARKSTADDVCSCLDQLILARREGFAEHLLCGVDHPYRYFHDRSRIMRFGECASAIRDICRYEVDRKLTCNDRQRRRFFHYLTDCGVISPESGIDCLISK